MRFFFPPGPSSSTFPLSLKCCHSCSPNSRRENGRVLPPCSKMKKGEGQQGADGYCLTLPPFFFFLLLPVVFASLTTTRRPMTGASLFIFLPLFLSFSLFFLWIFCFLMCVSLLLLFLHCCNEHRVNTNHSFFSITLVFSFSFFYNVSLWLFPLQTHTQ